jgi:hypothetical protein
VSGFRPPPRPRPVAALNAAWGRLQRAGIARPSLAEASLIAAARRASGLHDFGAPAEFREPMRRMLDALENEARLHALGRLTVRQTLVRTLVNRLRLEAASDLHPEIGRWPVVAPVFIVGLPRTGTTLLHRLLTCEPSLRPLLAWEALQPAPLPGPRPPGGRDPRVRLAEFSERALRYLAPDFFAIHPVEAHAPEEDVLIMDGSFLSPTVDASLRVPSYSAWFHATDQRPMYRYMRRVIQLLLWQRDGRWLGKTPHHLEQLDALLEVFPDARVVHTHRDPLTVVASFCSMMAHGRRVFSDEIDPAELGAQLSEKLVRGVNRAMASRERLPADVFLDVAYDDLVADPMKEVRRVCDFIGTPLSPATEGAMERWNAANPQHKHGVHRYRLEDFGLEREGLAARFAAYCEHFGVDRAGRG